MSGDRNQASNMVSFAGERLDMKDTPTISAVEDYQLTL